MAKSNGKLWNASINFSQLLALAKEGNSAFNKSAKNQKIYVNLSVWVNEEADDYGNTMSIQLNCTKEGKEEGEKNEYVGNGKYVEFAASAPVGLEGDELEGENEDDLPF